MASKKTTTPSAEPIDTALASGVEAMKDGFEKAVKNYDQIFAFGKDNAEAVLKSANAAGKGIESINIEAFAYARKSAEESVAVAKAVLSSKTIEEAFHQHFNQTIGTSGSAGLAPGGITIRCCSPCCCFRRPLYVVPSSSPPGPPTPCAKRSTKRPACRRRSNGPTMS